MFGLFESKVSKATKAGIAAVRSILSGLQIAGGPGIPSGMWEDPYILGYFSTTIAFHAKMATSGQITGADLGQTAFNVFSAVTQVNAAEVVRKHTALAMGRDPEYYRGAEDAQVGLLYRLGDLRDEHKYPLLTEAKKASLETGMGDARDSVGGFFMLLTLVEEVKRVASASLPPGD